MRRFAAMLIAGLMTQAACSGAQKPRAAAAPASVESSTTPFISTVSPSTGPAGTAYPIEITILGRNFADSGNVVAFGPVTVKSVKAMGGGTRIVLQVPKETPSTSEAPPMPLMAGSYNVRVTTTAGASNSVPFVLKVSP